MPNDILNQGQVLPSGSSWFDLSLYPNGTISESRNQVFGTSMIQTEVLPEVFYSNKYSSLGLSPNTARLTGPSPINCIQCLISSRHFSYWFKIQNIQFQID